MKIGAVALPLVALLLAAPAHAQTPWERYLQLPTPANARMVQRLTYADSADNVDRLLDDLQVLEDQMSAGDTDAVRLAIRLLPNADGVYGETLSTMLGRLVRIRPALFLRTLRDARLAGARGAGSTGCAMASVTAPEFVDRSRARVYETRQRIAALMTVTDPRLRAMRDRCVETLKADLRTEATAG